MKKISMLSSLVLSTLLFAQDTKEFKLDAISTDSEINYKSEEVIKHPGTKNIISRKDLETGAIRNVDEALQRIPGVQIKDLNGVGILPKISVRGFGIQGNSHSNTGLILLDGVSVYGAPYSNIALELFPITTNMIDHIEFTKGAAAIWAGPNTFGGVINVISKPIPSKWENEVSSKITIWERDKLFDFYQNGTSLGNNKLYDSFFRAGGFINESIGVQFMANIIRGQSFRYETPTEINNFRVDLIYNIDDDSYLKSYVQYYDYFSMTGGSLALQAFKDSRFQNNMPFSTASAKQTRIGTTYALTHNGGNGEFNLTYYYQDTNRNFSTDSRFNSNTLWTAHLPSEPGYPPLQVRDEVRRYIVNGINIKDVITTESNSTKTVLTYGANLIHENIHSPDSTIIPARRLAEVNAHNFTRPGSFGTRRSFLGQNVVLAPFVSYEMDFDGLIINPALRFDFTHLTKRDFCRPNANGNQSNSCMNNGMSRNFERLEATLGSLRQLNGGLNIGYKISEPLSIFFNVNKSFLPQPASRANTRGVDFTSNAYSSEIGIKYSDDSVLLTIDYFGVLATNQAIRDANMNLVPIGATLTHGLESELYYNLTEDFYIHAGYTFIDARRQEDRTRVLPFVSRHQIIFGFNYDFDKTTLAYSSYYYSSAFIGLSNNPIYQDVLLVKSNGRSSPDVNNRGGISPAYYVGNLQISRPLFEDATKKIIGSLAVNNIFNSNHWFRGDGVSTAGVIPAPSRSYSATIRYLF